MGLRAAPILSGRAFGLKCLLSEERPSHLVSFCAFSTQRCLDPVHAARQGASGDAGDSRFASARLVGLRVAEGVTIPLVSVRFPQRCQPVCARLFAHWLITSSVNLRRCYQALNESASQCPDNA